ncbi:hypothetical protein Tsp_04665 [Trichinella spiralis]|uniref:hypothetical protein n=1 Tax=Trichinella spiralis TaxID=6334 RepID=UPI0001EFD7AF|nr:hypothetical protein Tsp_04665 [Trichinella spiralis]
MNNHSTTAPAVGIIECSIHSSDDEATEGDDASANARRKSYIWRRRPFNPKTEAFIESDEKSSVLRPIEYFRMYFTPQLLFHISFETNRKATQCLYSNLATTVAEIEVLIGMLTTMGVSEMPRYRMYWANQTRMDTVANCMSRNRFETLLRFLHFNDNDKAVMDRSHLDYDRFYKIRPLIESMRKTCLEETLGELQSVDEHIIPYKGRCKMKYYNPRNPDKWRLKVIARCAKNGFVHDFWLCDGMAPKVKNPVGFFAADVVMKRIDHKCRKWHRRIFFWAIHVSLTNSWLKYKDDCTKKGIKPRNMMDLMTFMLSVSDSLIKLEKTYVTRKRGRPQAELTVEEEAGPSRPVRRTRQPEDITRADQTGHWPEMMTTKKRCRVCQRTCQLRCMKCDIHLCIVTERNCFFSYQ